MQATAKWSGRPGSGHSAPSSRIESASQCWEPDPRHPSWPAVMRRTRKAEYMTAPDQSPTPAKALAQRGPSIHDGQRRSLKLVRQSLTEGKGALPPKPHEPIRQGTAAMSDDALRRPLPPSVFARLAQATRTRGNLAVAGMTYVFLSGLNMSKTKRGSNVNNSASISRWRRSVLVASTSIPGRMACYRTDNRRSSKEHVPREAGEGRPVYRPRPRLNRDARR